MYAFALILVVADEQERCPRNDPCPIAFKADRHFVLMLQHIDRRFGKGGPLPMTELPQPLADLDDAGVDADRRVVDENLLANATHIRFPDMALDDGLDRLVQIERNLKILGEMIQRAERQNP